MTFGTDIHGAHCVNPYDFEGSLTFPVAAPSGQSVHLSSERSQNLPDGLLQNLVKTFVVPRQCFLTPFFSCCATRKLTFWTLSEMSRQLLDGFP